MRRVSGPKSPHTVTIYVNAEGWERRGQQVYHFWADTEDEMHGWAAALGFTDFYPSHPVESHRIFRHYLLDGDQLGLALSCGAQLTDHWGITKFVAERTLTRETDPELIIWACGLLDKLTQARHI